MRKNKRIMLEKINIYVKATLLVACGLMGWLLLETGFSFSSYEPPTMTLEQLSKWVFLLLAFDLWILSIFFLVFGVGLASELYEDIKKYRKTTKKPER